MKVLRARLRMPKVAPPCDKPREGGFAFSPMLDHHATVRESDQGHLHFDGGCNIVRKMLRFMSLRPYVFGFFLFGSLALGFSAQERASDVIKGAAAAEEAASEAAELPAVERETEEGLSPASVESAESEPVEMGETAPQAEPAGPAKVVAVPITETINGPNVYILRRAIKTAIEEGARAVVFVIDTPGGYGSSMLEMMEAIKRFEGITIAYVDDEAMSAGAFISFSADEIWYHPDAVIGSAAVVAGSGQEIPETMRQKIDSYIRAKIRAVENAHPYKAKVMRAMMDADYELLIDGKVPTIGDEPITKEGELLALTATEALTRFGEPPTPLFGEGIADDLDDLLDQRFGAGNWQLTELEVTWSERLAKLLSSIAPVLVALGILGIVIEIKTPGFGVFGIIGLALLGLVFASNYIIGLAGWEPFIVMFVGLVLIAVDILFLPGTMVLMIIGMILAVGSLLWSLTDVWPTMDGGIAVEPASIATALTDLSIAVLLGVVGLIVIWRFLPQTGIFDRLVLKSATPTGSPDAPAPVTAGAQWPEIGARGIVTRPLHPGGEVEIDGRRYQARVDTGMLSRGEQVIVTRRLQFGVEVTKEDQA